MDITADQDRYAIPYYLTFRDEFQSTFSSLWANDEDKIRPVAYKTVNAANGVEDKAAISWRTYVRGTDFFAGFNYPREKRNCNTTAGEQPYKDDCWVPDQRPARSSTSHLPARENAAEQIASQRCEEHNHTHLPTDLRCAPAEVPSEHHCAAGIAKAVGICRPIAECGPQRL